MIETASQIRPLPGHPNNPDVTLDAPARVSVGGIVIESDKSNDSFLVTSWQNMVGIPLLSPLTIRASIRLKDSFLRHFQPLPNPHSIIHFTGDLLTMKNNTAFVAVDDHSFYDIQGDEFDTIDIPSNEWPIFEELW